MRISFHNGTVHKCARVTLVGIANHVFKGCLLFCGQFPFHACGKSSAPTATQTGTFDLIYYLFRSMVEKGIRQSCIPIAGNIFFYVLRVDETTIAQCDAHLFPVEIHMFRIAYFLFGFRIGK